MSLLTKSLLFTFFVLIFHPLLLHLPSTTVLSKYAAFKESILSKILKSQRILDIRSGSYPIDDFVENLRFFQKDKQITVLIVEPQEGYLPVTVTATEGSGWLENEHLQWFQHYFGPVVHSAYTAVSQILVNISVFLNAACKDVKDSFWCPKPLALTHFRPGLTDTYLEKVTAETGAEFHHGDMECHQKASNGVVVHRSQLEEFQTKHILNGHFAYQIAVLTSPSLCSFGSKDNRERPILFSAVKQLVDQYDGEFLLVSLDLDEANHNATVSSGEKPSIVSRFRLVVGDQYLQSPEIWESLEYAELQVCLGYRAFVELLHAYVIVPLLKVSLSYNALNLPREYQGQRQAGVEGEALKCEEQLSQWLKSDGWTVSRATRTLLAGNVGLYGVQVRATRSSSPENLNIVEQATSWFF